MHSGAPQFSNSELWPFEFIFLDLFSLPESNSMSEFIIMVFWSSSEFNEEPEVLIAINPLPFFLARFHDPLLFSSVSLSSCRYSSIFGRAIQTICWRVFRGGAFLIQGWLTRSLAFDLLHGSFWRQHEMKSFASGVDVSGFGMVGGL